MANKNSWDVLVVLLVLIGAVRARAHSPRGVEMEKLLKKLNKPAIKTIKSPDGDIIDCVDIYKQPAFDHPLLKNHTIEMRPSFFPEEVERGNFSEEFPEQIWQRHGSCPKGTIPIRRVLESDIARFGSSEIFGAVFPNPLGHGGLEKAGAMLASPGSFYSGIGGTISIWNPNVAMEEYTDSLFQVRNGVHYINVGWMVVSDAPSIGPRLFVAHGSDIGVCVNLRCPDFVQYNHRVELGGQLTLSRRGGNLSTLRVRIRRNAELQHWEVSINGQGIGYYPFSAVGFSQANNLQWIGRVLNLRASGLHTITQMGSGENPIEGYGRSAHFQNVYYLNENNVINYPRNELQIVADYPHCYNAIQSAPLLHVVGPTVYFGGRGGLHCDQA